jgi:hypothetical protein
MMRIAPRCYFASASTAPAPAKTPGKPAPSNPDTPPKKPAEPLPVFIPDKPAPGCVPSPRPGEKTKTC